jgi:hypothetical protein
LKRIRRERRNACLCRAWRDKAVTLFTTAGVVGQGISTFIAILAIIVSSSTVLARGKVVLDSSGEFMNTGGGLSSHGLFECSQRWKEGRKKKTEKVNDPLSLSGPRQARPQSCAFRQRRWVFQGCRVFNAMSLELMRPYQAWTWRHSVVNAEGYSSLDRARSRWDRLDVRGWILEVERVARPREKPKRYEISALTRAMRFRVNDAKIGNQLGSFTTHFLYARVYAIRISIPGYRSRGPTSTPSHSS